LEGLEENYGINKRFDPAVNQQFAALTRCSDTQSGNVGDIEKNDCITKRSDPAENQAVAPRTT